MSAWCRARLGNRRVEPVLEVRQFDIPWMVLDASGARDTWDWTPVRTTDDILDEILEHAVKNPDWLDVSRPE
jgi:nucleoside-diphosphate-sugar epimerase